MVPEIKWGEVPKGIREGISQTIPGILKKENPERTYSINLGRNPGKNHETSNPGMKCGNPWWNP